MATKKLVKSGLSHDQAEAIVATIEEMVTALVQSLLTPSEGPERTRKAHDDLVGQLEK